MYPSLLLLTLYYSDFNQTRILFTIIAQSLKDTNKLGFLLFPFAQSLLLRGGLIGEHALHDVESTMPFVRNSTRNVNLILVHDDYSPP